MWTCFVEGLSITLCSLGPQQSRIYITAEFFCKWYTTYWGKSRYISCELDHYLLQWHGYYFAGVEHMWRMTVVCVGRSEQWKLLGWRFTTAAHQHPLFHPHIVLIRQSMHRCSTNLSLLNLTCQCHQGVRKPPYRGRLGHGRPHGNIKVTLGFRCTSWDQILFMQTWFPVEPPKKLRWVCTGRGVF